MEKIPFGGGKNPAEFLSLSTCKKRDSATAADRLGLTPNQGKDVSGSSGKGGRGQGCTGRIPAEKEVACVYRDSPKKRKIHQSQKRRVFIDIFVFLCLWEFLSGM